jgi:tRNA threonylcarbamoyladenosine biosynthesis protein TsaE
MPIFHFDTYRLKDEDEFYALGPDEYFDSNGITFVEWADRFPEALPAERIEITMEVAGETARRVAIQGTSPRIEAIVEQIVATW